MSIDTPMPPIENPPGTLQFQQINEQIGVLVINNPAKRNALNAAMWADLPRVLKQAESTAGLRVLIVRGEGPHFASGADISKFSELYKTPETSEIFSRDISAGFEALAQFPLPTIAMIRGACVGGGCGLALCCDIRFADDTSKFAITPAKLGLIYPYGDLQRLIEAVGIPNAKDILFSARLVKPDHAREMGLINQLCKPDDLNDKVMAYAQAISQLSPQSLNITKQMFAAYQSGQFGENAQTTDWFLDGFISNDFKEGYSAFLQKRIPDFS